VPAATGAPGLILGRGVPLDDSLTTGFITLQWVCVGVIIALDFVTLFLATWLFLVRYDHLIGHMECIMKELALTGSCLLKCVMAAQS
jgi:hypothetical protein